VNDRTVRVGNLRLRVRVGGEGPPLLMLHGFASGADGWPAASLREVARSRSVVALDLPGHGLSDPVRGPVLTSEDVVKMVVAAAQAAFGSLPRDWYGYSMGARIALSALRAGVPIRALALESPNPGIEDEPARRARSEWDTAWASRFDGEDPGLAMAEWLEQPIFASRARLPTNDAALQRGVRAAADPVSLAAWLRGFGTGSMPPAWAALEKHAGPLHVLVGEADTAYVEIAGRIAATRSDARVQVVPGVGHAPHMEAPTVWGEWLRGLAQDG